jgi:2-hydroxychromene-2-carboxylate isomerase
VLPVDLGRVFPVSGGLPLARRAPQRQAYRLVELERFRPVPGLPMVLQPRFFPVAADDAARLIIAVDQADGADAALGLTGAILAAVWAQERDIARCRSVLAELLQERADGTSGWRSRGSRRFRGRYDSNTRAGHRCRRFRCADLPHRRRALLGAGPA